MNDISPGNVGFIYKAPARDESAHETRTRPAIDLRYGVGRPANARTRSNRISRRTRPCVSSRRRFLHWVSALALVALYLPLNSIGVDTHKLIGTLVLGFFFARMVASLSGDRVNNTRHGKIENLAAVTVQGFILCALLVLPITGLLIHSLSGPGVAIGGFSEQFLKLPAESPTLVRWLTRVHLFLSLALLVAVFFHISGALKHHFVKRDDTLLRMLTGGQKSRDLSAYTPRATVSRGRLLSLVVMGALIIGVSWVHVNKETQAYGWKNWENLLQTNAAHNSFRLSTTTPGSIEIAGRHHGNAFSAAFSNFMVNLELTDDGEPATLDVAIDAASFRSDLLRRDELVAGKHWLDTDSHPLIEYKSSRFKQNDTGDWVANGYLNFKRHSLPVPVAFQIKTSSRNDDELLATGQVALDRFGLGLGIGPWFNTTKVARSFELTFRIHLSKSGDN